MLEEELAFWQTRRILDVDADARIGDGKGNSRSSFLMPCLNGGVAIGVVRRCEVDAVWAKFPCVHECVSFPILFIQTTKLLFYNLACQIRPICADQGCNQAPVAECAFRAIAQEGDVLIRL